MLTEQQKEELERILKEIGTKHFLKEHTLYYKESHRRLHMLSLSKYTYTYERTMKTIFSPRLEYAVYIDYVYTIRPSRGCIEFNGGSYYYLAYIDAVEQLIPHIAFLHIVSEDFIKFIKNVIRVKLLADSNDPLSQIFAYKRLLITQWPEHVYVCPYVYIVRSYNPDPASIFSGKEGIIAYCMTLHDLILLVLVELYVADSLVTSLKNIWSAAIDKLDYNDKVRELLNQDKMKACDINFIKSIIRKEIEETNSIMKQYGIVRIILPLGQLES